MKNKKELIMNAAMSLVKTNGITGLTVASIAKKAGIGKGTIYEYFKSKEEIFYETMKYGLSLCVIELDKRSLINNPNYKQAIFNFIDVAYEIIKSQSFLPFSSDSNQFIFEKAKINQIQDLLKDYYLSVLKTAKDINQIGIKEQVTKKPLNPLTHFVFINMVFSTLYQKANGNIDENTNIKQYLYETTIKIYN